MSNAQIFVLPKETTSKLTKRATRSSKCRCAELDEDLLEDREPEVSCSFCCEPSVNDEKMVDQIVTKSEQEESISQTVSFSNPDNSMDRFIPCRMKENLQAKFEAASQN